ncbi:hypothetical protein H6G76_33985 [Nostoc sp. FACHB-152]|uniref:DUF5673 domain-containing protein n=1 Tax=unclassified Nostoc TaxID=2593658 RepID=UPI001689149D|nr:MULTISPECIES: DUF5673 domain-containing protein [unclassified Nostoc]MBD2452037.1 hypothetical protein [Nostoc sp. FACHB-152]MBD2469860.1 hypothetical protein [Nostoc sp. FACHB-145]
MYTFDFTHITSLFIPIIVLVILLGIRYQVSRHLVGKQNAAREILYTLPWLLLVFTLLLIPQLTKYSRLILVGIYEVYFLGYLIYISTWHWRKVQAGYCLLNIDEIFRNKRLVWLTLLSIALGSLYSALFIHEAFTQGSIYNNLNRKYLAETILIWSSVIIVVSRYLSKFELRENGICYRFSLVKWENITSYSWDKTKNNTLIIIFQPRLYLVRTYWLVPIPLAYKDTVNQILAQYLHSQGSKKLILPTGLSDIN